MKRLLIVLLAAMMTLGWAHQVKADNPIGPINITPVSPHFEAHDGSGPYPAWVYPENPDVWTFDFSSFSSQVAIALFVSDYYPAVPGDFNVYWDNNLLGNTGDANTGRTFFFNTIGAEHKLKVDWVNQTSGYPDLDSGGSYYNLVLDAAAVPLPGALVLLGAGLVRLVGYARRKRALTLA